MSGLLLWMLMAVQSPLPLTTLAKSDACGIEEPQQKVVRTTEEWVALWKAHAPERPLPAVDFTTHMVLGVFLGTRPTSGYSVEIRQAVSGSDPIRVEYADRRPDPQTMTAQILTAPCHIVAVAKQTGAVTFTPIEASPRD